MSLFLFLFFSYGHVRNYLETLSSVLLMSMVWVLVFILGSCFIIISKKSFSKTTKILNVVSIVLVALSTTNIVIHQFTTVDTYEQKESAWHTQVDSKKGRQAENYPDIYFIILDAYARGDILKELYDFDNTEFLNFLKERGFYIADRATSNYSQKGLTIASTFSLEYLDRFVQVVGEYNTNFKLLEKIIGESLVVRYLREKGYAVVAFASRRGETELDSTDIYLRSGISIDTLSPFVFGQKVNLSMLNQDSMI